MKYKAIKVPNGCFSYIEVSKDSDPEILMDDGTWLFAKDYPEYYLKARESILVPTWGYEFHSLKDFKDHLDKWRTGNFRYLIAYRNWDVGNTGMLWPTFGLARDIKPFVTTATFFNYQEGPITGTSKEAEVILTLFKKLGMFINEKAK